MSLLLDALHKTKNDQPETSLEVSGSSNDSDVSEAISTTQFESLSDASKSDEPSKTAEALELGREAELDAELSIADEVLDELLATEEPELELQQSVSEAAHAAVDEALEISVEETVEQVAEYIAAPSPSNNEDQAKTGGLVIEAQTEAEPISEEILSDAPLIQAYRRAQQKRKRLLYSAITVAFLVFAGFVYQAFLSSPSSSFAENYLEPELAEASAISETEKLLQEIGPEEIPSKLPEPEFIARAEPPNNVVTVRFQSADDGALQRAYRALQDGDLTQAKTLYLKLSRQALTQVDALLGLGSIAIQRGDENQAKQWLQQLLSIDPNHRYAQAILATMTEQSQQREMLGDSADISALKTLQSLEPDNAAIAFLLGNRLAARQQWAAAQTAYFSAYSLDSSKPNHAVNLAITLDHLGKHELARDYYQRGLQLAEGQPVDFDRNAIKRRLEQGP